MAALTEEQSMLKDQASAWARDEAPVQKFREMRDAGTEAGFTPATWESMVEMGWISPIDDLVKDIRANPDKYLTLKVEIF